MGEIPLILFLDIDGVLNNAVDACEFSPYNMTNIKILINLLSTKFDAVKIVLSSDWRRSPINLAKARAELHHIGIEIFDTTPITHTDRRSEIRSWLNQECFDKAIILDDLDSEFVDPQMDEVLFFQTDFRLGLTETDIDEIVANYP